MIEPNKLSPFRHFCMTIGAIPSSYKESLTYYEMLEWLCNYLQNTVIPAVNNNAEALTEVQGLYAQLKEYVDNYFENLDLQTEIDTKLDEMVEDGTMAQIINQEIFEELNVDLQALQTETNRLTSTTFENPVFPAVMTKGNHAKAVFYNTTNHTFDIFQKTTGGYLMYELDNATGDTSSASVGGNWDLIRLKKIQSSPYCYAAKNDYASSTGTITTLITDTDVANDFEKMLYSSADELQPVAYKKFNKGLRVYGISAGGSLTYNMKTTTNKKANVLFYSSSGSSKNVTIKVGSVAVKSGIDLSTYAVTGNGAVLIEFEIPCKPSLKDYTITIENNDSNNKTCYVSCVNYFELKDYNGEYVDSFKGMLFNRFYINANGSSDYAIRDADLDKWCGSFHGGETAITQKVIAPYPLSDNAVCYWENNFHIQNVSSLSTMFYLTPNMRIDQYTNINDKANMLSQFDFNNDGMVDMTFDYLNGTISTKQFYTSLTSNSKTLDIVKNPNNELITDPHQSLKQNGGLAKFAANGSTIKMNIYYTKFNNNYIEDISRNGWVVGNNNNYNKFYYGVIEQTNEDPVTIDNVQFRKVIECLEQ